MVRSGSIFIWAMATIIIGFGAYLLYVESNSKLKVVKEKPATAVEISTASIRTFTDIIEALGTAKANESVVLTARVSETVKSVNFDDGIFVKKGQLLIELINSEEMAQRSEAKAVLREAEQQLKRIKDLQNKGNASEAVLDARVRSVEEARSRLNASDARLADRVIRAPFAGVLGLRNVSEGTLVSPGAEITTLDDIETIKLDFSIPERFLSVLNVGQKIIAKAAAFEGLEFNGVVKTINSRVDPSTRAIVVRAEIPNGNHQLRPGMLLTVDMIGKERQSLSIPETALVPVGADQFLFKYGTDDIANRQIVTIGARQNGYVEILSGLKSGDKVIVSGTTRLKSGSKVRLVSR